jgi:hypothetical protein
MAGSQNDLAFEAIETLFYKSVTRVMTLFAFLPSTFVMAETERYQ